MGRMFDWRESCTGANQDLMKLQQGQLWKKDNDYLRIIHWERLSIEYKLMHGSTNRKGTLHRVSKKEFCRLLKGAELIPNTHAFNEEQVGDAQ
jgi:hypothetical protein